MSCFFVVLTCLSVISSLPLILPRNINPFFHSQLSVSSFIFPIPVFITDKQMKNYTVYSYKVLISWLYIYFFLRPHFIFIKVSKRSTHLTFVKDMTERCFFSSKRKFWLVYLFPVRLVTPASLSSPFIFSLQSMSIFLSSIHPFFTSLDILFVTFVISYLLFSISILFGVSCTHFLKYQSFIFTHIFWSVIHSTQSIHFVIVFSLTFCHTSNIFL